MTLRPLRPGDEEFAVQWGQDQDFCLANGWDLNMPAERIRKHQRNLIDTPPPGLLRLGIEFEHRLIGDVALQDMTEETGEFGIAIGESGLWGQGLGRQAGQLLLAHAFGDLHLRFVWAEVHEPNVRSHALMNKLGFTETGRRGQGDYQGMRVGMVQYRLDPSR